MLAHKSNTAWADSKLSYSPAIRAYFKKLVCYFFYNYLHFYLWWGSQLIASQLERLYVRVNSSRTPCLYYLTLLCPFSNITTRQVENKVLKTGYSISKQSIIVFAVLERRPSPWVKLRVFEMTSSDCSRE